MSFAFSSMLPKDHLQYYCKAKEFFGPTNIFIRCRNVQAHALIKHSNSDLVGIQTNRVTRGYRLACLGQTVYDIPVKHTHKQPKGRRCQVLIAISGSKSAFVVK